MGGIGWGEWVGQGQDECIDLHTHFHLLRTGMRRAFSLEAIPSELMYHTLDSPAYQLEGCPGHAYQPSLGLPLVPGVGREAEFSNIAMPTDQEIMQFQEVS